MNTIQQQIEQNEREINTIVRDIHAVPFTKSKTKRIITNYISNSQLAIIKAVVEEAEGMKTDERKVETFGEWQAETYEGKMLVNAVLDSLITRLNELLK